MTPRAIAVGVLALALVAPASAGAVLRSGVQGTVHRSPGGACSEGEPCDGIGRGVLVAFTRLGRTRTVTTTDMGRFKLLLAPGRYRISAPGLVVPPAPAYVVVRKGRIATLTISFASPRVP
jgi:hypothetical protein